jgi:uncharacterized protein YndB with AHSA1/START domain
MLIEEYVFIDAPLKKVWDTFTDLTCWKDWSTVMSNVSSEAALLTEGKRFRFCIRPFDIPVNIEPIVEEIIPGLRIVWSGRKHGITARHEFTFQVKKEGVLLTSRETFSGAILKPLKFFFPKRKIRELSILMLHDIKAAAENEKSAWRLKER